MWLNIPKTYKKEINSFSSSVEMVIPLHHNQFIGVFFFFFFPSLYHCTLTNGQDDVHMILKHQYPHSCVWHVGTYWGSTLYSTFPWPFISDFEIDQCGIGGSHMNDRVRSCGGVVRPSIIFMGLLKAERGCMHSSHAFFFNYYSRWSQAHRESGQLRSG